MKEKRIRKRFINSELENTINCDMFREKRSHGKIMSMHMSKTM